MKTLDDLLQDLYDCGVAHGKGMTYVYSPAKETKSAIKELVKSVIPEKSRWPEVGEWGWNRCRQTTIEAIDKL